MNKPELLYTEGFDVEFVKESHTYLVNGKPWPSVSQILKALGISNVQFCPEDALWRGDQVHLATRYFDEGRLNENTVPEEWAGYLQAYKKFREDKPWEIVEIEKLCINPLMQYAGTFDRLYKNGDEYILVDLKSGSIPPSAKYQLAAYANFFVTPCNLRRMAVKLQADGKYAIQEWIEISDLLDWGCLGRTYQIKKGMGHYE